MWNHCNHYTFRLKVEPLVNIAGVCHTSIPRDVIVTSVTRLGYGHVLPKSFFSECQGIARVWG